ncbi:MAG: hypothetical protein GWO20_08795 [Candidatus Korarchaeota archaeon]|nr:hypothetical protein [Candidatus Korarchaeota archaeon]
MLTKRETSSKSMMRNINEVEWKRLGLLLLATFIAVLFIPSSPLLMGFLPLTDFAIGISLLTLSILWFERKYRVAFYFTILAGGVIIFLALFLASIRVPSPISLPGPAPKQDLPALIPAGGFFIVAYILHKRVREKS